MVGGGGGGGGGGGEGGGGGVRVCIFLCVFCFYKITPHCSPSRGIDKLYQ